MKLRDVISPWPPASGWASAGPIPKPGEVGDLILKNARIATPARVTVYADCQGVDCVWVQHFADAALAIRVRDALKSAVGKRLGDLGELEI